MRTTLHVAAVEGALVSPIDERTGAVIVGRFVARHRKTREALPDGEMLPDHVHYRRAIARGELLLIEEVSA